MTVSAARIVTPGGADNQGIGPKRIARNDSGTKTSNSQLGPTGSSITQESEFHTEQSGRFDARGDRKLLVTLTDAAGADTFTLTAHLNGELVGTTAALNDDETAANVQTALRSLLAGTDLTVVTGNNGGPFTVTFNDAEFYGRAYPKLFGTGTGCTVAVTRVIDGATKRYLGETKYESTTELVGPNTLVATVTDATDEVQTFSFSAGTDGGNFRLGFRQGRSSSFAWNAELADIAAEMTGAGGMFDQCNALTTDDAPTVRWATPPVLEVEFVDWDTTDDAILTYDTTHASSSLEFATVDAGASAAARQTIIETWFKTIDTFEDSDVTVAEVTENFKYNITVHDAARDFVNTDFALAVTGTAGEDQTPDQITALAAEDGIAFTFENGALAGRPVRGGINVLEDDLEDGGIAEPGTLTITTAGVLGSVSIAYSEQAVVGDSVFGEAVNDATGKGGTTAVSADPGTPVVFAGLVPGAYTAVLRTVADRALSAPSTVTFTVASA